MLIESNQNIKIKKWAKLKQKKYRSQFQEYLVEGEHLVFEALEAGIVKEILIRENSESEFIKMISSKKNHYMIKEVLFNSLAMTETPQSVMAVCEMKSGDIKNRNRLLLLDRIQDPGNLGTLVRSAVAFGFDGIVLGEGCVDIYNEKVIRSTQGALFKIAIEQKKMFPYIQKLKEEGVKVFGTSLENGQPLRTIQMSDKMAFLLGNEGQGVEERLLSETDQNIFIEISKNTESLNVSIAGSIIMHEFSQ